MNGERLKCLRKERSMTQAALAELLGLDKSSVAKYETAGASPSAEILTRLADIFGDKLKGAQYAALHGVTLDACLNE